MSAPDFDLPQWLESLGMEQYAEAFATNKITRDELAELNDADLQACGVAALGDRKRLLRAIAALETAPVEPPAPAIKAAEELRVPEPAPLKPTPKVPAPPAAPTPRSREPAASTSPANVPPAPAKDASVPPVLPPPTPSSSSPASRRGFWAVLFASKFLFISIVVHLVFGAGATVFIVQRIQAKRKLNFQSGPPSTAPSKRALEHKVSMAQKKKTGGAPPQAKRIVSTGIAKVSMPDMPSMPSASNVVPGMMAGMGGAGFGAGMGFGSGMGSGMGGGAGGGGGGMSFFGFRSAAQSVVFVIDISGSMIMGTKDSASYDRLERETVKAIQGLPPASKMSVIAFSADTHLFSEQLVTAGMSEKSRAIEWLKTYSPCNALPRGVKKGSSDIWNSEKGKRHKGTGSDKALKRAFELKPNMIFFVSDGDPSDARPPTILKHVEEWQAPLPKKVVINSIAYAADSGEAFMSKLAEDNGGEFKNIK